MCALPEPEARNPNIHIGVCAPPLPEARNPKPEARNPNIQVLYVRVSGVGFRVCAPPPLETQNTKHESRNTTAFLLEDVEKRDCYIQVGVCALPESDASNPNIQVVL